MLVLAGVLFLLIAADTAREMADAEPGASVVSNLGYAVAEAFSDAYLVAAVALIMGVMVFEADAGYVEVLHHAHGD